MEQFGNTFLGACVEQLPHVANQHDISKAWRQVGRYRGAAQEFWNQRVVQARQLGVQASAWPLFGFLSWTKVFIPSNLIVDVDNFCFESLTRKYDPTVLGLKYKGSVRAVFYYSLEEATATRVNNGVEPIKSSFSDIQSIFGRHFLKRRSRPHLYIVSMGFLVSETTVMLRMPCFFCRNNCKAYVELSWFLPFCSHQQEPMSAR